MTEPKDRLHQAISGYDGVVDAWTQNQRALKAGGVGKDLMVSNHNGNRPISRNAAATYAKVFGHTAGWYLYGEAAEPDQAISRPNTKISDPKEIRKLLSQIDRLSNDNIKVLLSAIEGFRQANTAPQEPSQRRDQSGPASRRREAEPLR